MLRISRDRRTINRSSGFLEDGLRFLEIRHQARQYRFSGMVKSLKIVSPQFAAQNYRTVKEDELQATSRHYIRNGDWTARLVALRRRGRVVAISVSLPPSNGDRLQRCQQQLRHPPRYQNRDFATCGFMRFDEQAGNRQACKIFMKTL